MIIVSPFARQLRNGKSNHPKNYPYWDQLIPMIKTLNEPIVQVGSNNESALSGIDDLRLNLSLDHLGELIGLSKTWVSVDSFFQHYAWHLGKPGVVLWGQSDPNIFGHPENINLLKDRKYLRDKQFWLWEQTEYNPDAFVQAETVFESIKTLL